MSLAKQCPMCGRYPAIEEATENNGVYYAVCRYPLCGLYEKTFRLDEWNARPLDEEKKAPSEPKAECNLKVEPTGKFCSKHATELINNLNSAAWFYGHSRNFSVYTAVIKAKAALEQYVGGLERRENDLNELLEIVRVIAEYRNNRLAYGAMRAYEALEKFLNEERQ